MPVTSNFTPERAVRPADAERFAAAPMPTEAEEVWRYRRIDDLDLDRYAPVASPSAAPGPQIDTIVSAAGGHAALVVSVDGGIATHHVDDALASKGVTVTVRDGSGELVGPEVGDAFV